jgi:carbamoyltransferase
MNQEYFSYAQGLRMTNGAFSKLFGSPPRAPESKLTQKDMDLARSIQVLTEEVMLKMARQAFKETGLKRLCMAGGVALNCVGNGRIQSEGPFDDIWIQPAAGDAGGALGVALCIWHRYLGNARVSPESLGAWQPGRSNGAGASPYWDGMKGALLGPRNSPEEVESFLKTRNLPYEVFSAGELPEAIADFIATGKIVGLHQGRMEFGPRALGCRSIIGDARSPQTQSLMNLKIKYRESFRPFAPSVQREYVADWFEMDSDSPYMLLVAGVRKERRHDVNGDEAGLRGLDRLKISRSDIPAVTHVDFSARVQTVRRDCNPLFWDIIEAFRQKTGCPVIVNTSFNVRGEPIVCTLEDSYRCFMRTEMDILVMENFVLRKENQPHSLDNDSWQDEFKLD